jgi:hypothetical protein
MSKRKGDDEAEEGAAAPVASKPKGDESAEEEHNDDGVAGLYEEKAGVTCTGLITTARGEEMILFHSPFEIPLGDHLDAYLGECNIVLSAPVLGMHVYTFPPNARRDAWALVTMGLSGYRMPYPPMAVTDEEKADVENLRRAELLMYVDPSWQPDQLWPVNVLRAIAQYIVANDRFVSRTDGLGNFAALGEPYVEGGTLSFAVVSNELHEERDFYQFEGVNPCTLEKCAVQLLHVVGLTAEEYEVKRTQRYAGIARWIWWGSDIDMVWRNNRPTCTFE